MTVNNEYEFNFTEATKWLIDNGYMTEADITNLQKTNKEGSEKANAKIRRNFIQRRINVHFERSPKKSSNANNFKLRKSEEVSSA